ncbi:hypothetical protein [Clostridium psychrophilum]|uniref:hypothetical protein n=1 Tax=Clostridium psychrophilum TaxID=132926 RepID=UPI001C0D7E09|nr:hypothetical protein [Clostridium psychrophilum]MBU3182737.1 hypothetical protein [Clostridium psychrophilum]
MGIKMYKLLVQGYEEDFTILYYFSTNYIDYFEFSFVGIEQEKYNKFLTDLEKHISPQPIYINMKLHNQQIDRGLYRKEVFTIKNANDFINRLYK